jgi:hypothetical protein
VDVSVRLADEQAVVNAADPSQVAYVYYDGATPRLRMPVENYQLVDVGQYDVYVPIGS